MVGLKAHWLDYPQDKRQHLESTWEQVLRELPGLTALEVALEESIKGMTLDPSPATTGAATSSATGTATSTAGSAGTTTQSSTLHTSRDDRAALALRIREKLGPIAGTRAAKTAAQPKLRPQQSKAQETNDDYQLMGLQPALTDEPRYTIEDNFAELLAATMTGPYGDDGE